MLGRYKKGETDRPRGRFKFENKVAEAHEELRKNKGK